MKRCICLDEATHLIISKKVMIVTCEDCLGPAIELIEELPDIDYHMPTPIGFGLGFFSIWRTLHHHYFDGQNENEDGEDESE